MGVLITFAAIKTCISNYILFYVIHASSILKIISYIMPSNYYLWVNVIFCKFKFEKSIDKDRSPILSHQPLHKKCSFPLRISSVNVTKSAGVTFTEEILKGKLRFLSSSFFLTSLLCAGVLFPDSINSLHCTKKVVFH